MRILNASFALCAFVLSLTLISSSAFAGGFLQKLEGTWKGRGTLQTMGKAPKKDPLACRIKAEFNKGNNTLAINGRCGAAAGTTRFQSLLTEASNGKIAGSPILQRGDLAKIALSGKAKSKSLKLSGTDSQNELYVTFILQGDSKFQSQSGLSQSGEKINSLVINWKKQ